MPSIEAKLRANQIDFVTGDALFTSYKFGKDQAKPWFFPLVGPCGEPLTVESAEKQPHHRSLWLGCDDVNGHDFWNEKPGNGRIVSAGQPQTDHRNGAAEVRHACEWVTADGQRLLRDFRIIHARVGEDDGGRLLDLEFELEALSGDVHFGPTANSLFAVQVAPSIAVHAGGTLHNAMSDEGAAQTSGATAFWCDYSGPIAGAVNGLAIYSHPDNPWHPPHWFTTDDGFMSPSPLSFMPGGWTIPAGQKVSLRYLVLAHDGDVYDGNVAVYWGEYAAGYA